MWRWGSVVVRARESGAKPVPKVFGSSAKPLPAKSSTGIRPGLFYGLFAGLFGTNCLTLVALMMAPDISVLLNGQNEMVVAAYEDRIAQLRVEVDRLHSRNFAQTGDINLQLHELTQQQEVLIEQHQLVKQLAEKAAELGIEAASLPAAPADSEEVGPLAYSAGGLGTPDLAAVGDSMRQMMEDSRLALAGLAESATSSTAEIVDQLGAIGIKPKLPDHPGNGIGGPLLLPEAAGPDLDNIVDDANDVYLALARFKAARGAIDLAPVHKPLDSLPSVSSGFGNRTDPFTGGRAYHSGIDFSAPGGTIVLSAGYGKVSFVGEQSGYGNLVEVTHSSGLVTRYGHLSAFLVKEGQIVSTGSPVGKVGSTGRSTGPHLHFEVRRQDIAEDPGRYLAVGKRLQRYLGT